MLAVICRMMAWISPVIWASGLSGNTLRQGQGRARRGWSEAWRLPVRFRSTPPPPPDSPAPPRRPAPPPTHWVVMTSLSVWMSKAHRSWTWRVAREAMTSTTCCSVPRLSQSGSGKREGGGG